jgi:hypothetical protein
MGQHNHPNPKATLRDNLHPENDGLNEPKQYPRAQTQTAGTLSRKSMQGSHSDNADHRSIVFSITHCTHILQPLAAEFKGMYLNHSAACTIAKDDRFLT